MLIVNDLSKKFGTYTVFSGLGFQCVPGTVTTLTGSSGSGKSTLLNCLGGLIQPSAGSITVAGQEITKLGSRGLLKFRRSTVGYLFQDYALVPDKTVYNNIALAMGWFRPRKNLIDEALNTVGLSRYGNRLVFELSGGEQQRVALTRLLLKRPPLILADEPTGALDEANSIVVLNHLKQMTIDGATVIVATHDPLVMSYADQNIALTHT